jgi:phosphomannomutase
VIELRCPVQHYAWGDRDFLPRWLGLDNPARRPHAELWMGAHPDAPAHALLARGAVPLNDFIAADPARVLHPAVAARFGGQLPFLFKVLTAAAPLSVQVHPSRTAAEEGFAREEAQGVPLTAPHRNYRDPNHKPELLVALTDFYGLRGFRPLDQIAPALEAEPELKPFAAGLTPTPAGLRTLYTELMSLPQERVDAVLGPLVARLQARHHAEPFGKHQREYWLLRAHEAYSPPGHHDRGLFSLYLLNLVHLRPGQGMFLPAGVLHAYLEGAGVELMANSNNVLRGGLTPKHVDVAELLRNVVFAGGEVELVTPQRRHESIELVYPVPAAEFELSRLDLDRGVVYRDPPEHAVEIFVVISAPPGKPVAVKTGSGSVRFGRRQVFLVPAGTCCEITAEGTATLFKATVPLAALDHPDSGSVASGGSTSASVTAEPAPLTFRGRTPTALAFGTSGLRGLVTDITDLEAYVNTRGFLEYLLERGEAPQGQPVSLAGDFRPSTDSAERSILRAVARAIQDAGLGVEYLGRVPTPALTYYAMQQRRPSIMVTGSHIPFDRNGIKFNKPAGEVLKTDEAGILRAVERVRRAEYQRAAADSLFADDGMFKPGARPALPPVNPAASRDYVRRYLDFFRPDALRGLRVIVYQHSAVGRDLLVELLSALGASVIALARSDTFVPVDTEAITADTLARLQQLADEARARHGPIDAIVSTDGDSDRPLLAGLTAEGRVAFFGGDVLGIVVAEFLQADAVVVPISANDAVDLWAAPRGVCVRKTRIGSPYVIAGMQQAAASGAARVVGWEANGGFLTGTDIEREGRCLKALPTRDAALPLLAALRAAQERRLPLVDLFAQLPRRFSRAGLIDHFPTETSRALVRRLTPTPAAFQEVEFAGDGARLYRADGTTEAATGEVWRACEAVRRELESFFQREEGFGRVVRLNTLDGVRVWFDNGDIAHVRPSGNAPQLRIYAVADHPERAEQIVALALREPDGILRRMERAVESRPPASAERGGGVWTVPTDGQKDGQDACPTNLTSAAPPVQEGQSAAGLVDCLQRNIELAARLFAAGETPEVIGTVCGSRPAQAFWQAALDRARASFGARAAISFHEDLPTNQAFGLLLLWQRLKPELREDRGALVAFVFGEGTRATPFTETDNAQKPAMATFVRDAGQPSAQGPPRFLSMVEVALKYFVPVQQYLWRSGFRGLVVKWGDEVQIPTLDLAGADERFRDADIVRFVSLRAITAEEARHKDWVGVDAAGRVTTFIPRRPLEQMEALADRGLVQRRHGRLFGGVNLGSIAVSYAFLDCLLEEFRREVNDPTANRQDRPALDPEFFTALTVAAIDDAGVRAEAWDRATRESPDVAALDRRFPDLLARLRRAIRALERREGRRLKLVAMDFHDQFWGDVGQHTKIYEFYLALNQPGPAGDVARTLAGLSGARDAQGNRILASSISPRVQVSNSVLIHVELRGQGVVEGSVLIGTRAGDVDVRQGFDVLSTVSALRVEPRGGTYKVVSVAPVHAAAGERLTTLFLPDLGARLFRVREDTDLKDKARTYDVPILGNPLSFRDAHREMSRVSVDWLQAQRQAAEAEVLAMLRRRSA